MKCNKCLVEVVYVVGPFCNRLYITIMRFKKYKLCDMVRMILFVCVNMR